MSDPLRLVVLVVSRELEVESWACDEISWHRADSVQKATKLLSLGSYDAVTFDSDLGVGMSGFEVLRDLAPFAGLVVLGSQRSPELAFDAVRYGAHVLVSKRELTAWSLADAVRSAVDRRWLAGFVERKDQLLDAVFRSIAASIAVLDQSGVIVTVNRAWERQSLEYGDAIGFRIGDRYLSSLESASSSNATVAKALAGLTEVLEGRAPSFQMEYDFGERWFVMQIDPMPYSNGGVTVTHTDVTDRRRAQAALSVSERDLRRLIEGFPVGIAMLDQGRFVFVNRALLEALGETEPEALLGTPLLDVVEEKSRKTLEERLLATVQGQELPPWEARAKRKDGVTKTLEIRMLEMQFEGRASILIVARDVSEQRAFTARIMQMDRMMSVGLLAAGLGHEINNPLSFVTANVDLALRSAADLEGTLGRLPTHRADPEVMEALVHVQSSIREMREALSDARQGARRVQAIAHDLRTFSRPERAEEGPVDLASVLDAALHMAWNEIRHRARLVRRYGSGTIVVANEAHLGQVFLNLVTNAAHAISVGAAEQNEISVRVESDGEWARIEISDTGSGIDEDALPRIFDPFFTTKPLGQGTGLGLSIVRNLVNGFGGEIEIQSKPGHGTKVRVSLPLSNLQPNTSPSTVTPLEATRRPLTVLVVDDEPLIGRVVTRSLGPGHQVEWVASGREALERLEGDGHYDVIFLDIMMPEMTGVDVYEALEQRAPHRIPRILFLSGGAFTPSTRKFLEGVENRRLTKPFEARVLRGMAEEVARSA